MGITVAIALSARCTMKCGHCCFSCTPKSTDLLAEDVALRITDQALEHPSVTNVGLSGGEPLLRKELVVKIASRCKTAKKGCSIVTNGFWAITPNKAQDMINLLWNSGVRTLTVSYDDFHAPYIGLQRIRNALEAGRSSPIHMVLNMAVTREHDGLALLDDLGQSTVGVELHRFPVIPCGAARSFDRSNLYRLFSEDHLLCPEFSPLYHFNGYVYPCCSPTVCETQLALGSVSDLSVSKAIDDMASNALLYVLRTRGVGWILALAREKGLDVPNPSYWTSPCEACLSICGNAETLSALYPEIVAGASRKVVQPVADQG
jgi:YydG family peptide modification radical SAM enzyme